MKINFTMDLDKIYGENFEEWITNHYYDGETGYQEIDGEIPKLEDLIYEIALKELINKLNSQINTNTSLMNEKLEEQLNELTKEKLDIATSKFGEETLKKFFDKSMIKVKKNGWSNDIEEITMNQYIEEKLDYIFKNNKYTEDGEKPRYSSDKTYSISELLIKDKITSIVEEKFEKVYLKEMKEIDKILKNVIREKFAEKEMADSRVDDIVTRVIKEIKGENK